WSTAFWPSKPPQPTKANRDGQREHTMASILISTFAILTLKILTILKKGWREGVLRVVRILRYRRLRSQQMDPILPRRYPVRGWLMSLTRSPYDRPRPVPAASCARRGPDTLSRWHGPLSRA